MLDIYFLCNIHQIHDKINDNIDNCLEIFNSKEKSKRDF